MPGYDKTGPNGQGPSTGGGFGRCAGRGSTSHSGARQRGALRGVGRGGRPWGGGRGRCFGGGQSGGFGIGRGRGFGGGQRNTISEDVDTRDYENEEMTDQGNIAELIAKLTEDNEELQRRLTELEAKQNESTE